MVPVRRHLFLSKTLSLVVIAALISLRLSSLTETVFVTPLEDAIFDIPFIVADSSPADAKPIKVKPKRAFDFILAPLEELDRHGERPFVVAVLAITEPNLKDILSEIFIPPESVS
jgi:hypothetical protein